MTPLIVEGVQLHAVTAIPNVFDCYKCARYDLNSCVRIKRNSDELYFDGKDKDTGGHLWCIALERDMVFINNTPEDIARYVAARLENT
jgi:hypothetical protein